MIAEGNTHNEQQLEKREMNETSVVTDDFVCNSTKRKRKDP